MLTRKQMVLVKVESIYGQDSTPDGSDRIYVAEMEVTPYEGDRQALNRLREQLGAQPERNVAPYVTANITVGLAGSGTVGTPPAFDALLRACGMSVTESASDVLYQPVQGQWESCTIYYRQDGQVQKITGALGTPDFDVTSGQDPTVQFQMTGLYNKPEASSPVTISELTQADEIPVNAENTSIQVHGHAACTESLSLSLGNTVNHRNLINCEKVRITDREATGSLNIEAPAISTKDYFAAVESHSGHTTGPVTLTHGKTPGNIVELAGTAVQLSNITYQDSDGVVHYQLDTRWLPGAGGAPELTLKFT